jgi:hypothetical protein
MTVPSPSAMLDEADLAARVARLSLEQKVRLLTGAASCWRARRGVRVLMSCLLPR